VRADLVAGFLEDSRQMVNFPGYGDEFYDDYLAICQRLEAAVQAGDRQAMHDAYQELARRKKVCHARYK